MDKTRLLQLLGEWPSKSPLSSAVVDQVDCGDYIRERVEYDTEPGERISAFVLVPKHKPGRNAPAVFCHHQHANNFALGKSEVVGLAGDPDQALAVELVRRGYVVLAPDALGFEDRNYAAGVIERQWAHRLVAGKTLLAKVLHDVGVGLDYLQTRIEVGSDRFGFVGHSYGGRMAIWVPTVDDRVVVSISHCGALTYRDSISLDHPIQPEFCVPGILSYGDLPDIARLQGAFLYLSSTTDDKWSPSASTIYEEASQHRDRGSITLRLWPGNHVFTEEMRQAAYDYLDQHLRPEPAKRSLDTGEPQNRP